jgi:hypothetical protein
MFTLKFNRDDYQRVVSATEYDKDQRDGFAFIIANGVEYQVGGVGVHAPKSHQPYNICFIENGSGKTIDRVGPFGHSV